MVHHEFMDTRRTDPRIAEARRAAALCQLLANAQLVHAAELSQRTENDNARRERGAA